MLKQILIVKVPMRDDAAQELKFFTHNDAFDKLIVADMYRYAQKHADGMHVISSDNGLNIRRTNFITIHVTPIFNPEVQDDIIGVTIEATKRGVPYFKSEWSVLDDCHWNIIYDKTGFYHDAK